MSSGVPSKDQKKPEWFCVAPFSSIVQDYRGRSGPCPYQSGCWDLSHTPIQERWNDPQVTKMRQQFIDGEKPKACERCFIEEMGGFHSHRMFENAHARYTFDDLKKGEFLLGPKIIVIRTSNLCNLACRTCHSVDSSFFKHEGEFYANSYGDVNNRYRELEQRQEFSLEDMDRFVELSSNLEEVHFYGGEPMLNQTHQLLLERLIKERDASQIKLFYCTNGTRLPCEKLKNIWAQFKNIHLNFSIDGIRESFEYLRWPAKWDKVQTNMLECFNSISKEMKDMSFGVNITVSIMNIYDLPEIYECLNSMFYESVSLTTVHDPTYFSVVHLPQNIKKIITEKLSTHTFSHKFIGIVDYMNNQKGSQKDWVDFVLWTKKMDHYRSQKFSNSFPAYFQHMQKIFAVL